MKNDEMTKEEPTYAQLEKKFTETVLQLLSDTKSEVAERNEKIVELDEVVYGSGLGRRIRIPAGHDKTKVNWLKRAVEIHTDQFMGNGFQIISTYNSKDIASGDPNDKTRIKTENKVAKEYADQRRRLVENMIEDNGGQMFFKELAQNASAIGDSVVKSYYDESNKRWVFSQVESVENFYAVWSGNDFRKMDACAYVYQVSKVTAARDYGCSDDTPTSPLGQPLQYAYSTQTVTLSNQPMVTVIEVTGYVSGWAADKNKLKEVEIGKETELNALIVGDSVKRLIGDSKKLPRYYLLPNKRIRRRPWGVADITEEAIDINLTYIETLSDWRTVASKVNFPKFKATGFGPEVTMPKPKPRTVEVLPLSEGQDIGLIDQGDANQIDFTAQIEELKDQFIRETGISRVLFSDPTVTLNSNQALMTSMKPTTDIAQAKKALWSPVLTQMFKDALETLAEYDDTVKELVNADDDWTLKAIWPDYVAKYDPSAASMLINRLNAGTISVQSFLEQIGETKEEVDRITDEMENSVTAAIIGKQLPMLAQMIVQPQPTAPAGGPGGSMGNSAQISTPANNTPGSGIMSQPGSGATSTSPTGAVAQAAQAQGA